MADHKPEPSHKRNPYATIKGLLDSYLLSKPEYAALMNMIEVNGGKGAKDVEKIPRKDLVDWLDHYYKAREKEEASQ